MYDSSVALTLTFLIRDRRETERNVSVATLGRVPPLQFGHERLPICVADAGCRLSLIL